MLCEGKSKRGTFDCVRRGREGDREDGKCTDGVAGVSACFRGGGGGEGGGGHKISGRRARIERLPSAIGE